MVSQEQAIRTRVIKNHIDRENISKLCREQEKTIEHLVSERKNLVQKQYKLWKHDRITQVLHWQLEHAKSGGHRPVAVVEHGKVKVIWDMKIQNDKTLNILDQK